MPLDIYFLTGPVPAKFCSLPKEVSDIEESPIAYYGDISLREYLSLNEILSCVTPFSSEYPVPMEMFKIHEDYGQSYGYTIYRTTFLENGKVLRITNARDLVIVMINYTIVHKGSLHEDPINVSIENELKSNTGNVLHILVENCGRVNYGRNMDNERKGILGSVERYFAELFPLLRPYQFSRGGPVIAFQVENEYGTYGNDVEYMKHLQNIFKKHELNVLLFVCDNEEGLGKYKLDGVLQTVNFVSKQAKGMVDRLRTLQPDKPVFVTEFWDDWFDHWGEKHHKVDVRETIEVLKYIIDIGGSFNFRCICGTVVRYLGS